MYFLTFKALIWKESQRIFPCHPSSWALLRLWLRQIQRGLRYCLFASFPLCSSEYYQAEIRCSFSPLLGCTAFTKLWNLLVRVLAIWNLFCAWINQTCFLAQYHTQARAHKHTHTRYESPTLIHPEKNSKLQPRPERVWMWHVSQLPRSPELDEGWLVGGRGVQPQAMSSPPCVSCYHSPLFFPSLLFHFDSVFLSIHQICNPLYFSLFSHTCPPQIFRSSGYFYATSKNYYRYKYFKLHE